MNPRKNLILIKNEIKTPDIKFCRYNTEMKKVDVQFNNGKTYSYANSNVEWLKEPQVISPNAYLIGRDGRVFFGIEAIYAFEGTQDTYWHICFSDGSERDYSKSELQIVESCLNQEHSANVFDYIKQIASLSDLRNETGEKILAKRFDKISFVGSDVALAKYLNPSSFRQNLFGSGYIPIFHWQT